MAKKAGRVIAAALVCLCLLPVGLTRAETKKIVRVGLSIGSGQYELDSTGTPVGYAVDYVYALAHTAGWTPVFIQNEFSALLDMLDKGELDMIPLAEKGGWFADDYDFSTETMGSYASFVTRLRGPDEPAALANELPQQLTLAVLTDSPRTDAALESLAEQGIAVQPVFYTSYKSIHDAQNTSSLRYALSSSLHPLKSTEDVITRFLPTPLFAMVQKGNTALLREIDQTLKTVKLTQPRLEQTLYRRNYPGNTRLMLSIDAAERAYLDGQPTLRATTIVQMEPLSYLDEQGEACGILPDVMREIGQLLGVTVEFVMVDNPSEAAMALREGRADVAMDVSHDYRMESVYKACLTEPFMDVRYVSLKRIGNQGRSIYTTEALLQGTNRVEQSPAREGALLRTYNYPTQSECLQAVLGSQCDQTTVDVYIAQTYLVEDKGAKLDAQLLEGCDGRRCMAVSNAAPDELYTLLSDALDVMSATRVDDIVAGYTLVSQAQQTYQRFMTSTNTRTMWYTLGVILAALVLAIVLLVVRFVKTHRSLTLHNQRYSTVIAAAYDEVAELRLESNEWYQLLVLDNRIVRTKMRQPMDQYLEHFARQLVHPEDETHFRDYMEPEHLKKLVEKGGNEYFEYRRRTEKGDFRWNSMLVQGMHSSRRAQGCVMLYSSDIENSKQEESKARQRLQEALRNAEKASAAKGEFMSRISHEIRTPLNAIIGFMAIGQQNADDPAKVRNCLQKAGIASHHLLGLINDVLDISAVESGKIKIENHEFNFRELISALGAIFFDQAKQKGLEFRIAMDGVTEETLVGDSTRLNQILLNLISNAVKFTPKGGHVWLDIHQQCVTDDAVHLRFVVRDDGIGMSREFQSRIFSAFEQEESATHRRYGGSGLGLSIVKNMVTLMGGQVTVESEQNKGSTFTVTLPFGRSRCELLSPEQRRAYGWLRVMVVDDEQSALEYASMLLRKLGVRFDTAISGHVALDKARQALDAGEPYDLFLVDWLMPDMDGAATVRALRQLVGDKPSVVVITGFDQSAIEAEARDVAISRMLTKPLFQSTLVDLLGETTGKQAIIHANEDAPAPDLTGRRVLLAEDNELNREIALELLGQMGLETDAAENGQEAVEKFTQSEPGHYQLILMDIQMPVMDGHDAARAIRASQHSDAKTIPIIAMTANAFPEDVSAALASGMNSHLAKPIDIQVMHKVINHFLAQGGTHT